MSRPELHRGKLAQHPRVLAVRPLTREDLACITEKRVGPPRLKAFRTTHHRLARLIALGLRPHEISRQTGFSISRINALQDDPAFKQLVSEYTGKVNAEHEAAIDDIREIELDTAIMASRMINDRVHAAAEDPENSGIALRELVALTADRYDRFGYSKHTTQTKEVYNFAAEMKTIAAKSGRSNVIDARPSASSPVGPATSPSSESPQEPLSAVGGFRRRIVGGQG